LNSRGSTRCAAIQRGTDIPFRGTTDTSSESVVQLVDRKVSLVVRITFDIPAFDCAGGFNNGTFDRDVATHFAAHGGRWDPPNALPRAIHDASLHRVKCQRL
jgi:hypothetical protein